MAENSFGRRLKELRSAAGLTQPVLAEKVGMSKSGLADLEQGRYQPSWDTVVKLAAALGCSCEAFQQAPAAEPKKRKGKGK